MHNWVLHVHEILLTGFCFKAQLKAKLFSTVKSI